MKITIIHEGITASIEAPAETIDEAFSNVIRPALLAVGFQPNSIDEILDLQY